MKREREVRVWRGRKGRERGEGEREEGGEGGEIYVLLCLVCLTLLASFFLPSHLSFKNMYMTKTARQVEKRDNYTET